TFLITVARQYVDAISGWLGRALMTQTWALAGNGLSIPASACCGSTPSGAIEIPWPPLQSVTSIKYLDANGQEQTLPPADYTVDTISEPGLVIPATAWPGSKMTI